MTANSFATVLGYASSEKIGRLFRKKDANPSYEIIYDIANKFVEINIEWLITGLGPMLKTEHIPDTGKTMDYIIEPNTMVPCANCAKLKNELTECKEKLYEATVELNECQKEALQLKDELLEIYKQRSSSSAEYYEKRTGTDG